MSKRTYGNRYQVIERIGIGGMAEVFKATDSTLGRTVAVKVMLPQYASDATFAARFRQEAQAAANLTSPFIVNIYDWGKDGDEYYIVMEYVRGTDLKSAISQRGAIHPRKVAEIGSQVCSGLSIAHSYGIIHRDIKSANIMVQTDGNVKIMDFGIAQAGNANMTQDSSVLGTAHYVSPEQAQGHALTGASDLYSLGVVMYEAATGQLPFDGPDAVSVALKQVSEQPVPPREINPNIDPALEAIIMRALSKDPHARFNTANEMRQALDDFLSGRSKNGAAAGVIAAPGVAKTRAMSAVDGGGQQAGVVSDNYGIEPEKPKSKKKLIIILAVVLVLVIAGGAVACKTIFGAEKQIVPDLTGMTQEDAIAELERYGFTVGDIRTKASTTVEEGHVISTDPGANESARAGSRIDLTISSGPAEAEQVQVPDLTGKTKQQAESLLAAAGLTGIAEEEFSESVETGKIIRQEPAAGSTVAEGSAVTYYISGNKVQVPNLTGFSLTDAQQTLNNVGLYCGVISYEDTSDQSKDGQVFGQNPRNVSVARGSSVNLSVYRYVAPQPDPQPEQGQTNGS